MGDHKDGRQTCRGENRSAASIWVCNYGVQTSIGARGTFIAPYDHQTPRRSPRLRKNEARVQLRSADTTLMRAALECYTPVDVLESVVRMSADPAYSHVRHPSSSRSPMHESGRT